MKKHVVIYANMNFSGGFCEQTLSTFQKLKKYVIDIENHNKFLIILLFMILRLFYPKLKFKKPII